MSVDKTIIHTPQKDILNTSVLKQSNRNLTLQNLSQPFADTDFSPLSPITNSDKSLQKLSLDGLCKWSNDGKNTTLRKDENQKFGMRKLNDVTTSPMEDVRLLVSRLLQSCLLLDKNETEASCRDVTKKSGHVIARANCLLAVCMDKDTERYDWVIDYCFFPFNRTDTRLENQVASQTAVLLAFREFACSFWDWATSPGPQLDDLCLWDWLFGSV